MMDILIVCGLVCVVVVLIFVAVSIAFMSGVKRGECDLIKSELMIINLRQYICSIGMHLDFQDWLEEKYRE
jgi:hypothetical protein